MVYFICRIIFCMKWTLLFMKQSGYLPIFFFRELVHQRNLRSLTLIDRFVKRFHLCTGFQSHYQFFYGNSHFCCHFPRRRFPLQPARQCFSHLIDPVVIFLQRTAYLQYPVVPEITFDLSDDHGNCIGRKFHIIGHVKLIHCFQKSDAADLVAVERNVGIDVPREVGVVHRIGVHREFHPNDNRATVVIPQEEFLKYLAAVGNSYEFIELY